MKVKNTRSHSKKKILFLNILFWTFCLFIVTFLLRAPEETTPFLPHDNHHEQYHLVESKKAAEKFCLECHSDEGEVPLTAEHPPKFRCLFCHKRN